MMKRREKRMKSRFRNISIFMSINRLRGTGHRIKNNTLLYYLTTFLSLSFSFLLPASFSIFCSQRKKEENEKERVTKIQFVET